MKKKKLCIVIFIFVLALSPFLTILALNVLWEIRWRGILSDMKGNGEAVSWEDFKNPFVPDNENAAIVLKEAFDMMKTWRENPGGSSMDKNIDFILKKMPSDIPKIGEIIKWPDPLKKEVAGILYSEHLTRIFGKIQEATTKPAFNLNMNYKKGFVPIPDSYHFITVVKLLILKAFFEAEKGNVDIAYDNLLSTLELAQYLDTEPFVICNLMKIACVNRMIYSANTLISEYGVSEENALRLLKQLNKIDADKSSRNALRLGEKCLFWISGFRRIMNGTNTGDVYYEWYSAKKMKELILSRRDFIAVLNTLAAFDKLYDLPPWEREKNIEAIEKQIPQYCFFAKHCFSTYSSLFKKDNMLMTDLAMLKINLALHICKSRTGKYPESLDELKPSILDNIPRNYIDGKAFQYKNNGVYK